MRVSCQVALLTLSMAGTTMAQSVKSHLAELGAKRTYSGISHIEVDLGQRNTLLVGFDRYEQVVSHRNIDSVLRLFVGDYQQVDDTTQQSTRAVNALFRLGETERSIEVRPTTQSTTLFLFRDEQAPIQVKTRQDTLQLVWTPVVSRSIPQDFSIYLLVNSLSDIQRLLREGGVNKKLQDALQSVQQYKAHDLTSARMSFDMTRRADGNVTFMGPGLAKSPFLSFQPGIGIGFISDDGAASINLDLQLVPSRFRKVGYTVGYTSNFLFKGDRIDFVNIGMAFYRTEKNSRLIAFNRPVASIYIGYSVYSGVEVANPRTIRVGGTVFQKGFFKVQPELYYNPEYRGVSPGLRLVVGL